MSVKKWVLEIHLDKVIHFVCGLLVAILASSFATPYVGLASAVLAGIAKEIYDWIDYGVFDKKDLVITIIGGLVGALYFGFSFAW